MLEAEREYECTNPKCNFRFKVQASLEQDNTMEMPVRAACPIRLCLSLTTYTHPCICAEAMPFQYQWLRRGREAVQVYVVPLHRRVSCVH